MMHVIFIYAYLSALKKTTQATIVESFHIGKKKKGG